MRAKPPVLVNIANWVPMAAPSPWALRVFFATCGVHEAGAPRYRRRLSPTKASQVSTSKESTTNNIIHPECPRISEGFPEWSPVVVTNVVVINVCVKKTSGAPGCCAAKTLLGSHALSSYICCDFPRIACPMARGWDALAPDHFFVCV